MDVGARRDGPDGEPEVLAQPMQGSAYSLPSLQQFSYLLSFLSYLFSFLGLFGFF